MTDTKRSIWAVLALCAGVLSATLGRHERRQSDLPTVDLGYEIHEGLVNATGNYYIFSNVPYAEQPVGDLRFRKPVAIEGTSSGISNGTSDGDVVMCPQAYPQWVIELMAEGSGVDSDTMAAALNNQPGQTEACLLLDIHVPAIIFDRGSTAEAPVLVWIHGGGFTFGSKSLYGSPAGLIARSQRNGEDGVIVVSMNYRLGMFGWLAGDDVTPNLGLYDQRLALEWVQQYIALFGGDKNSVTVMGESAGASSIVHHITAYGGTKTAPFKAAIPQSPAFQFNIDLAAGYEKTLAEASNQAEIAVNDVAALRSLSTEALIVINQATVNSAVVGTFGFGPGPDGTYVPDIPQVLLYNGKFNSEVNLLISHTSNESIPFLPRDILTANDVRSYVQSNIPQASDETIDTLLTDPRLYPDILNSEDYPWTTQYGRAARLSTDISFACTTRHLSLARGNDTYSYLFAYPPGWHAEDVPYVFFNGDTTTLNNGYPVDGTLAQQLQDYIVAFAQTGDPNAGGPTPLEFPIYGSDAKILELGFGGFSERTDDLKGERCQWLQQAMVDGRL
ncbi:alpha/beta-hydrolase [Hypoxylon crocopeplum]|nr:alpha/beta-hydrolase [Hypoxylon crocopeplum]